MMTPWQESLMPEMRARLRAEVGQILRGEPIFPEPMGALRSRLRSKRISLHLTVKVLARKIGKSKSCLTKWESGERNPSEDDAQKWMAALS